MSPNSAGAPRTITRCSPSPAWARAPSQWISPTEATRGFCARAQSPRAAGGRRMTAILDTSFLVSLIARASALLDRYADLDLDFADACAVALAERLNVRRLLTLDRRHFAAVRPRHCPAFDVLPS
jgi:hypothetical protein